MFVGIAMLICSFLIFRAIYALLAEGAEIIAIIAMAVLGVQLLVFGVYVLIDGFKFLGE